MQELILENNLQDGMIFKNVTEACRYLGYQNVKNTTQNLSRLSHYCKFERDNDHKIYIKKVYDEIIPFRTLDYKYNVDDIISNKYGEYKIIDKYKTKCEAGKKNRKTYLCKCLADNYIFEIYEHRIDAHIGCPICGGKKPVLGYTTLYDEHSELMKYLVDPEYAKSITSQSKQKILCKCPKCGCKKEMSPSNLTRYGFSCGYCSDHISYPNKFIRNFLTQLNIDYYPEKSFEWSDGKIYDEYISSCNMIIENHGIQHYVEGFRNLKARSLKLEQANDKYKEKIARNNNIQNYIILDCRYSDMNWIKSSIMSSKLPTLLNFTENDIDWIECNNFAKKSIIEDVCKSWIENHNLTDLANKYKLDVHTIQNYLTIGASCNLCNYEKNNKFKNGTSKASKDSHSKPIYCETIDAYFYSKFECEDYFKKNGYPKFNGKLLYSYINAKKSYNNLIFKYITKREYNIQKEKSYKNNTKVYGELYKEKYVLLEEIKNEK